ncbi:SDR family oxidoreductase [Pedobacter montanisoli]|uniref:dTDP-4-dehydrorhamnose reductase n=1 Tax=Pedobacter montanisoli TaxID=2923277 RepID=A0ABS9ZVT7_9SPHI|nr:SDR family oxidoreductase [Pedobacter montanisoli]MCJ0742421.1 SDR family oxidoreductase [Pedobacter montanisoli]
MKKILVTGSNGLLGQKLTDYILSLDNLQLIATGKGKNRVFADGNYTYEEMNICDIEQVSQVLRKHKPDTLIHAAAITNVDTCHADRELCQKVNVEATANLIALCEELAIHFIYISTDFVFDGKAGPYKETDLPNPVSYYGESKLEGERLTQQMKGKWAIVRTILVYGILKDMSRSNIVLWAKNALLSNTAVNVVNDQWRMPTLAEDLAWASVAVAEKEAEGIFHISGPDMMRIADIVYKVADFWNLDKSLIKEVSSATLNQEAKRPLKTGFILDKAMTELNYRPHSFEDGLALVRKQLGNKE